MILFVATLGVTQLLLVAQSQLPRLERFEPFPTPLDTNWEIGGIFVRSAHIMVLVIVPALTLLLAFFLKRTKYGTAIRAAADNPDAAADLGDQHQDDVDARLGPCRPPRHRDRGAGRAVAGRDGRRHRERSVLRSSCERWQRR